MQKKDDTPQFEKDAKATRDSLLANIILGRRKPADATLGSANTQNDAARKEAGMKCGGSVKKYAKGGSIDGVAQRGKTRGKYM